MHTTYDDYDYDDAPNLPLYSNSEAAATDYLPTNLLLQDEYATL